MMYSLTVTINYPDNTEEYFEHSNINSRRELMEIAQVYLNDPEASSVVYTVVRIKP